MRAIPIEPLSHIAIMTKRLEALGEVILDEPVIKVMPCFNGFAMFISLPIDVVYAEELDM